MKPKFSGHDTFPLRYGWLHKAVNLLVQKENHERSADESAQQAIVTLGVGRNMVNAIRYWAEMVSVISSNRGVLETTDLGRSLFDSSAKFGGCVDPYLERIGSIWLIHYHLNANQSYLTSYRYFFNFSNFQGFEKSKLVDEIYTNSISLTKVEPGKKTTIRKDVDCFLHTYVKKARHSATIDEDHFASPLSELGLIKELSTGYYVSELNDRKSLPVEIFSFALCNFIKQDTLESGVNSIDFDSLLSKPTSPGRIFRLSEQGLSHKLDMASEFTSGGISWVDSAGLRQIIISDELKNDPEQLLCKYYGEENAF